MSNVLDGNFYPTDGSILSSPKEQLESAEAQEQEVMATVPLLRELLKRFDDRIQFYKSLDSIPDDVKVNPEEFMHIVTANGLAAKCLEQERTYIKNLIDEHL